MEFRPPSTHIINYKATLQLPSFGGDFIARTTRKEYLLSKATPSATRIYNAGLYLRLSKEDMGATNHNSIEIQRRLLEEYISNQSDIKLTKVFCDNGATGTNFNRSAFEQMISAINRQEIDCIVVKDLSRFGRNYIETGYYLENIFPLLGIRFISVNDYYDTLHVKSSDDLVVSLKNIVNSLFAKDISKKSISALHRKQEKGEFIGSFAPYGYIKNPNNKHKLIIDPLTSPIVKNIFKLRLDGLGYREIANILNSQDIPSPSMARLLRNGIISNIPPEKSKLWVATSIKNITSNMVYAGHMAQGKQMCSLWEGIPKTNVAKDNWIIVRNTHEPIVSEYIWNSVFMNNYKETL